MTEQAKIVILGAGGHGRVVAQCIVARARLDSAIQFSGYIDPFSEVGQAVGEYAVLGGDHDIPALISKGQISHFVVGLGTVRGGDKKRRELYDAAIKSGLKPATITHPSAIIAPDTELGAGTVVMPGAVINTGARIGDNVIVNTRASIDHDCVIMDDVHIAPGCVLSGNVTIGANSHIGVGSCAVQGVMIGENVTAGAGTVIIKDVEAGVTIVGAPQRIIARE